MTLLPKCLPDPESRLAYCLDMASLAEEFAATAADADTQQIWDDIAERWHFAAESYGYIVRLQGISLPGHSPLRPWMTDPEPAQTAIEGGNDLSSAGR